MDNTEEQGRDVTRNRYSLVLPPIELKDVDSKEEFTTVLIHTEVPPAKRSHAAGVIEPNEIIEIDCEATVITP